MLEAFALEGSGELVDVLKELYWTSLNHPSEIIKLLLKACQQNKFFAVPLFMAVLMSKCKEKDSISLRPMFLQILLKLTAEEVMDVVEYFKNKDFGKGLGSRVQNLVREVMERWDQEEVKKYSIQFPMSLYRLVRLIHPRYKDARGEVVVMLIRKINIGKAVANKQ